MACLRKYVLVLSLILTAGCKEKYTPPLTATNTNFLVVEGNINIAQDTTFVTLSRTKNLNDTGVIIAETGAQVAVESEDGTSFPLYEKGNGEYYIPYIASSSTGKYRLTIKTSSGSQYASDFVQSKITPAIDSINWKEQNDGVHIYANAHDDQAKTQYYRWDYVETWEYHAPFDSYYKLLPGTLTPVGRTQDEHLFKCWHAANSSSIVIASTTNLSKDNVYEKQVNFIPVSTERLGVTYSILVKQYALTAEAYNYWQNLSKNTEQLGSLFDAQPSLLTGNMHCITNTAETVLGFISASTVEQKRIFIHKTDLQLWQYPHSPYAICDTVHIATSDDAARYYGTLGYIPVGNYSTFNYYAAPLECVDCREQGGTLTKPPFWP